MNISTINDKVDAVWDVFYSGGISNPLVVIQQITYLMFIHDLSILDEQKQKDAQMMNTPYTSIFEGHPEYRWNQLISNEGSPDKIRDTIANKIFPMLKKLNPNENSAFSKYMGNAIFAIDSADKLTSIISKLNDLYKYIEEEALAEAKKEGKDKFAVKAIVRRITSDIRGDIYEHMLGNLSVSGKLGQFRSPKQIVEMAVELVKPTIKDVIVDPCVGSGSFLLMCSKYIRKHHADELYNDENITHFNTTMFTGYDIDRTMLEIAAMNMMQHGIENPNIRYKNGLTKIESINLEQFTDKSIVSTEDEHDKYTLILTNPPFKGAIEENTIHPDLAKYGKKTEILFLAQFIKLLKVGGRAAVIVPNGVLFGSGKAHKLIRKELIENQHLKAVISMPSGVFKPYAGVSTAVLVFEKTNCGGTDKVWFYDMKADGFSLDDKRTPVDENDIPDIIARYNNLSAEETRKRTEQSFLVPKEEIASKDYDLSFNKYAEIVYKQEELPSSKEILTEIYALKDEFCKELDVLKTLLEASDK